MVWKHLVHRWFLTKCFLMDLPKCRFGYKFKIGGHLKYFSLFLLYFYYCTLRIHRIIWQGFQISIWYCVFSWIPIKVSVWLIIEFVYKRHSCWDAGHLPLWGWILIEGLGKNWGDMFSLAKESSYKIMKFWLALILLIIQMSRWGLPWIWINDPQDKSFQFLFEEWHDLVMKGIGNTKCVVHIP